MVEGLNFLTIFRTRETGNTIRKKSKIKMGVTRQFFAIEEKNRLWSSKQTRNHRQPMIALYTLEQPNTSVGTHHRQ